jgi:hypothetical protein
MADFNDGRDGRHDAGHDCDPNVGDHGNGADGETNYIGVSRPDDATGPNDGNDRDFVYTKMRRTSVRTH